MMQLQHRVRFSLKDLVRAGTVRLIDRSWLNAHLEGGGALMRRQDLPETAFVATSLELVIEILMVSESKILNDRSSSCSIE